MLNRKLSESLALRLISLDKAKELYDLIDENRLYLREWLPWLDDVQSESDTEFFITSQLEKYHQAKALSFLIIYRGQVGGIVGFNEIICEEYLATIGYWLAKSLNGNGIIHRSIQELIVIAKEQYRLQQLEIWCATENLKSRAIPERLGFTHRGRYERAENLYGRYLDHEIYVLEL